MNDTIDEAIEKLTAADKKLMKFDITAPDFMLAKPCLAAMRAHELIRETLTALRTLKADHVIIPKADLPDGFLAAYRTMEPECSKGEIMKLVAGLIAEQLEG